MYLKNKYNNKTYSEVEHVFWYIIYLYNKSISNLEYIIFDFCLFNQLLFQLFPL